MFVILNIIFFASSFVAKDIPVFKNLKVLRKDISEKELDSIMHHFTVSLGEKCNFCHVRNEAKGEMDFASDDNQYKSVARKMMLMADKINKDNFKMEEDGKTEIIQAVTCYTCHHGEAVPSTKPRMQINLTPPFPNNTLLPATKQP